MSGETKAVLGLPKDEMEEEYKMIIIRNFQMPSNCQHCKMCRTYLQIAGISFIATCIITNEEITFAGRRQSFCPLEEIK